MINPAQYTAVLQKASDGQLMQMLKRPDKIPSQFVVAEINRRQSMRQAAMADQQRQARVQEMMTAQQQMPQQQQPMGMAKGGPSIVTALGGNINSPIPEQVGIPPFDPARETYMEYLARVGDAKNVARMATADTAMVTDADIERPDTTARGIRDAEMFISSTSSGNRGDVEDLGSQASGVPSKASQREDTEPFFKFGGVNPSAVFSDGKPSDVPKAIGAGVKSVYNQVSDSDFAKRFLKGSQFGGTDELLGAGPVVQKAMVNQRANKVPLDPGFQSAIDARRAKGIRSATDDMINTNMAVREAEGMYSGTGNLKSKVEGIRQGDGAGPIDYEPGSTDFSSALGMGPGVDGGKKPSPTALSVVQSAQNAMKNDIEATEGGVKGDDVNTSSRPAIPTPVTVGGDKSTVAATTPNTSGGSTTEGGSTSGGGIKSVGGGDPQKSGSDDSNPFKITSETKTFSDLARESNEEKAAINDTIQGLMADANAQQSEALETYKTDMNALLDAQKKFMDVFEKNSMTPENRIFRSMIDAGLALAGSKEANFLNAVGEAGKVGIETFDRLNAEQKQNLFDKYSAAVDFQKAKVDINTKINSMANQITQGQIDIAKEQRGAITESQAAIQEGAKLDLDAGLQIDAAERDQQRVQLDADQLELARDRFGFEQETGRFNMDIKQRAQTVNELLANSELFKTVATVQQGDAKIDILSEQLGLDRDKLDWQKASTAIDQQLKAMGLDKPADSVAKLEWMKGEFGEDGLKKSFLAVRKLRPVPSPKMTSLQQQPRCTKRTRMQSFRVSKRKTRRRRLIITPSQFAMRLVSLAVEVASHPTL